MEYKLNVKGHIVLVDKDVYDEYFPLQHRMYMRGKYVNVNVPTSHNTVGKSAPLHRLIVNAPKGMIVDHVNNNPLDNRRENLRVCTQAQNNANSKPKGGTSQYKGVSKFVRTYKGKEYVYWRVQVMLDRKIVYREQFNDEVDAAKAYDKAALKYFGGYAYLNFPDEA